MPIPILFHLFLVFASNFFISPELTLYPYLISKGLQPYQNLIDQHFPLVFYGPLNLVQLGLTTPPSTLILFIFLILLTDLFAYLVLRRQPLIFFIFIICQFLLGGNTFWLETFILFFLTSYFYFNQTRSNQGAITAGLSLSLSLGLRPTLLPFLVLLLLFNSRHKIIHFLALPIIPLVEIIWLFTNHLWNQFTYLMAFNSTTYRLLALLIPNRNEIIMVSLAIIPIQILSYYTKKIIPVILLIISGSILSYPRFALVHLLPLTAIVLYLNHPIPSKVRKLLMIWIILILVFIFLKRFRFQPNNFYYPKSLYQQATAISKISNLSSTIYLFGGPDQLYQLTNTLPIGDYYLPNLPWYFADKNFVDTEIKVLQEHPDELVIVNTNSRLNGVSLLDYGQPIWSYIQANYQKIDEVDNLEIYAHRH